MRRHVPFLVLMLGLLAWPLEVFAASSEPVPLTPSPAVVPDGGSASTVVDVIKVEGGIDRPMADYVVGSLEDAEAAGHTVVLQLNTRGSLGVDPMQLARRVHALRVPVITWVGPPGSHAGGVGAMLSYASSLSSVAPGSGIGPLQPADLETNAGLSTADLATLEGWAKERGLGGVDAVLNDELSAQEAIDAGVVNELVYRAPSPGDVVNLLQQADGQVVSTAGGKVTLDTRLSSEPSQGAGVLVVYHELGPWKRVLHAVASPTAVYLLIVLAFAGFAFEFTQPGFGFAGVSGFACLGLGIYGLVVVPPSWWALALLVGGFMLLIADVQLRRLGVLSLAGGGCFAIGSWFLYLGVAPAIAIPIWVMVVVLLAGAWYYGFGLTIAQQAYRRIRSAQVGLVGLTGEARGDINPEGGVFVKGTLWRGRTVGEHIPAGTKVRVRGVDGLVLRVEPEPEDH